VLSNTSLIARRDSQRRGMTLLELLISLVLVGLMGSLIIGFLLKQERFYAGANEMVLTRTQVRQASVMMPNDLRAISPTAGDIYAMTDTSIDFRSTFGSGYVCASDRVNSKISVPPATLAKNNQLTNWSAQPQVNDSLAIYDDGASTSQTDDAWSFNKITAVTMAISNASPGCTSATAMMKNTDVTSLNPSFSFTLSTQQSARVSAGAAVRFFKKVHYSLYKSAADNLWYLGYYDCRTLRSPVCNTIQPIAGPLRQYVAGSPALAGLRFTYYDTLGAVTANRLAVGRISILLQGEGTRTIQLAGGSPTTFRDSLRIEVGLRNWR
jgi:prepilin-type N-terminal cleavage/methylation domain-containing protein